MSKNQRPLPQPLRFRQRRSGNLPRPVQLVNNFFFEPRSFFSERAARISPRRRSGNLSRPLLAVNRFLLLFSKNLFAPPSRPLGPARLSETFRPAAARTVYAPPRRLCQRLFIFFLIFLPHDPRFYRVFAPVRIQFFSNTLLRRSGRARGLLPKKAIAPRKLLLGHTVWLSPVDFCSRQRVLCLIDAVEAVDSPALAPQPHI